MALKNIQTDSKDLQLIQDNVATALRPLEAIPMTGGVLIYNASLTAGSDNLIRHALGRFPKIFFIGNLNVNTSVWSPVASNLNGNRWDNTFINLRCGTDCVVSVWVN